MPYDRIQRHADCLKAELAHFAHEFDEITRLSGHGIDPSSYIEQHISSKLAYDLVFHDAAGNIIGIQVGADDGSSVLLRSHAVPGNGSSGITSQIYAGHILGGNGMLQQGTVIVACFCLEDGHLERGTRYLIEESLPRLGIEPGIALLAEPSHSIVSTGKDWASRMLCSAEAERTLDHTEPESILCNDYDIPVIRCGLDHNSRSVSIEDIAEGSDLAEATFVTAALAYKYLLTA